MDNIKVLEMLNNGQLEELRIALQEEIYNDSIKENKGVKERYAAMKKYFRFANKKDSRLSKPYKGYQMPDGKFNVFLDGYTIVVTSEDIGTITPFDNSTEKYFDVKRLMNYQAKGHGIVDFSEVLSEAKSKGYKYKKNEIRDSGEFSCCFKYKDGFWKIGLLDQSFSIINDGKPAEVYYIGAKGLLYIKISIGICGLLPFNPELDIEEKKIVIDANVKDIL